MAYTREEFIKKIAPYAQRDMAQSGILASVTIAQAILESDNGNSTLATGYNNLFGIKGDANYNTIELPTTEEKNGTSYQTTGKFRVYPSWQESVNDHSALLSGSRYNLSGVTDYRYACDKLQQAGYATASSYAVTLKQLISQNNLTKYDTGKGIGYSGNTIDYADKIIQIALNEQGNAGGQKFWSWWPYSSRVAWCAIFVSWCAEQAGVSTSIIPREQGCWNIMNFAQNAGRYYLKGSYVPKKGDIFLFGGDHTGLVVDSDGTVFKTIEGNCSDMVKQRELSLQDSRLTGFFSPNYPKVTASSSGSGSGNTVYGKEVLKYFNDISDNKKEEKEQKNETVKIKDVTFKQSKLTNCQLIVFHGKDMHVPVVEEGVKWSLELRGTPGQLTFSVIPDKKLKMEEGDAVQFRWNKQKIFYGFIFEKKETQDHTISVTCYDQLRYLKNKDTYVIQNKRADQVIEMIAKDFGLNVGKLEKTSHVIQKMVEDDKTLFDIIENALNDTLVAETKMYVFYDDFGKLTLKAADKMKLKLIIDAETGQSYSYTSSINDNTYNRVKLEYSNSGEQSRDIYISQDSDHIMEWGILQYHENVSSNNADGSNATLLEKELSARAEALLRLYNGKTRKLQISKCFGDVKVRAGSSVIVILKLNDMRVSKYMFVEKVTHHFEDATHTMDLTLTGGDFVA